VKQLSSLLALIVLAGCASAPPPVVEQTPPVGFAAGIDMPTDARDHAMELKSSRLDFVARYYRDPASRWPTLSAEEARMVSSAGMKLVTVWESHSHRPGYFSYASGYSDAMTASRQARTVGQPAGSAIYFAVDFNAREPDITGPVEQYFRGVTAGLATAAGQAPGYKVGVYGSGAVCEYLKQMRLAEYAWLSNSTAWAGYDSFADWNIKQSRGSESLSFGQDSNQAQSEYGGFQVPTEYTSL